MIGLLTGSIVHAKRNPLIVSVNGVGYVVHVTQKTASESKENQNVTLVIHTHVREESLDLYGFHKQSELDLFELLLTVSGIGPKTALLVIDRGDEEIKRAVRNSDVDFFTTIPRLGKKNAQKIIIELKNKLGGLQDLNLNDDSVGETKQIIDALTDMGFARNEIIEAMKKIDDPELTMEQKIRRTLQLLSRK